MGQPDGPAAGGGDAALAGLAGLRPVRRGREPVNKNGRLVLRGAWYGRAVKVYEVHDATHARFVAAAAAHPSLSMRLPEVLDVRGPFVVAAWVRGRTPHRGTVATIAALQRAIHAVDPDDLPAPGYDHWRDLLAPRFRRAAGLLGVTAAAEALIASVDDHVAGLPRVVVHPDLTPANLVVGSDGHTRVVDNELLSTSALPLLDLCNTAHALGERAGRAYVAAHAREGTAPTPGEVAVLSAVWTARRVGSALVAGDAAAMRRAWERRGTADVLPVQLWGDGSAGDDPGR